MFNKEVLLNVIDTYKDILDHLNFVSYIESDKLVIYHYDEQTMVELREFLEGVCTQSYTVNIPKGDFHKILWNQIRYYREHLNEEPKI